MFRRFIQGRIVNVGRDPACFVFHMLNLSVTRRQSHASISCLYIPPTISSFLPKIFFSTEHPSHLSCRLLFLDRRLCLVSFLLLPESNISCSWEPQSYIQRTPFQPASVGASGTFPQGSSQREGKKFEGAAWSRANADSREDKPVQSPGGANKRPLQLQPESSSSNELGNRGRPQGKPQLDSRANQHIGSISGKDPSSSRKRAPGSVFCRPDVSSILEGIPFLGLCV